MKSIKEKKKILISLIVILVLAILFVGISAYFKFNKTSNEVIDISQPTSISEKASLNDGAIEKPVTDNNGLSIDVVDYSYYPSINNLDFSFFIATLSVNTDDAINIDLSHFSTSEGIVLNNVNSYVESLEKMQYYLGKENVVFQLISLDNSALFNIFIPVSNNSNNVELNCDLLEGFNYNLTVSKDNTRDIASLFYQADDIISDGKTYQLQVSAAFDITGATMFQLINGNLSEYTFPSTVSIFSFKLDAVSLYGDTIIIENAIYQANDGQQFYALASNIYCEKYDNILGQLIDNNSSGNLFFEAYNSYSNPVSYTGILKLYITGESEPIVVNVDLNK